MTIPAEPAPPAVGPVPAPPTPDEPLEDLTEPTAVPAGNTPDAKPSAPIGDIALGGPKGFADPLEPINRLSFALSQQVDRFAIRPVAMIYKAVVPKPARQGAHNALQNFGEPIVLINDIVQLRPGRAVRTLGRFLINSVLGLGGLFDIAKRKPFNLAHRNNGFANTLGYIGIGPIMYAYLPILGPTTLRDSIGGYGDSYFLDRNLHKLIHPNGRSRYFRTNPKLGKSGKIVTIIDGLDKRVENDEDLRHIMEDSIDHYAALRSSYLQDRAGEIAELRAKDGAIPATEGFDDPLLDPEAAPKAP